MITVNHLTLQMADLEAILAVTILQMLALLEETTVVVMVEYRLVEVTVKILWVF
jgi:hypothetical protein